LEGEWSAFGKSSQRVLPHGFSLIPLVAVGAALGGVQRPYNPSTGPAIFIVGCVWFGAMGDSGCIVSHWNSCCPVLPAQSQATWVSSTVIWARRAVLIAVNCAKSPRLLVVAEDKFANDSAVALW
jgi:hypothetical protein